MEDSEEHFLNFGTSFSFEEGYNMWVNGKVHRNQYSDLLYGSDNTETSCEREQCKKNKG